MAILLLALAWLWTSANRPRVRVEPSLVARAVRHAQRPSNTALLLTLAGVVLTAGVIILVWRSRAGSPSEGEPATAAESQRWVLHRSRPADGLGGIHTRTPHALADAGERAGQR